MSVWFRNDGQYSTVDEVTATDLFLGRTMHVIDKNYCIQYSGMKYLNSKTSNFLKNYLKKKGETLGNGACAGAGYKKELS